MIDNDTKKATGTFQDSTPNLLNPLKLREQADRQGYLFFKGLLNVGRIEALRAQILHLIGKRGLLDRSYPEDAAIADADAVRALDSATFLGMGVPFDLYREV